MNEAMKAVLNYVAGALLMILIGVFGAAYSGIKADQAKMEDRIYILQRDSVSEAKLNAMKDELKQDTKNQIDNIRNEIKLTNQYLERVLTSMQEQRLGKR